ncbi:MAG: HAMP domain-containing sensor histidine kinase, partial [Bacteroidota bacterium]
MERVQDNIDLVAGQTYRKNITLSSEISEPMMVFGDVQMINTILRNLLTNAIKFTARDGVIIISACISGNHWVIRVKDTGTGITPEILNKIFRIESKYSKKGTEMERGTGLGLILCKEFAEKHGGSILVETEPGKGSCFMTTLPLYPNPQY